MLYTIRYKLKKQKGNFIKYIVPRDGSGIPGLRADALALWHKLSQVKSVNEEPILEAALCIGGEITFEDAVQGNSVVQYYTVWQKMDEDGTIRVLIDDPEPPISKPVVEAPEEISLGSMDDEPEEEIKTVAPKRKKAKQVEPN